MFSDGKINHIVDMTFIFILKLKVSKVYLYKGCIIHNTRINKKVNKLKFFDTLF